MEAESKKQPLGTMKELENRIFKAGEEWRLYNTFETKVPRPQGQLPKRLCLAYLATVAK